MDSDSVDVGGPWFEDFVVGQEFDAPAVTLTAGHAALFHALTGDRLRLPLDAHTSRRVTRRAEPVVHPLLAINLAIGQSTWASQRVKANLFYRGLVLRRPVHVGDTLHTITRVVGQRQNRTQPGRPATGVVALEMTTRNQDGDEVLDFWRCPMIPCRDPQALTGRADDLAAVGVRGHGASTDRGAAALGCVGVDQGLARTTRERRRTRNALQDRRPRHGHERTRTRARNAEHGDGAHGRPPVLSR